MMTPIIVALAFLQPGGGHPVLPACLHTDPDSYYRPLSEKPPGVSDECWAIHEMIEEQARIQYAGCVTACMTTYHDEPIIMCVCFDDCGRAWEHTMSLADADVVICSGE